MSTFATVDPIKTSLKAEPLRFSNNDSMSVPAPPVFWAAVVAKLTVTKAPACSYDTVSVPAPPKFFSRPLEDKI
jgi:hypothetical protein